MSSFEDRLRKALDRDAPKGWGSLLRRSPADDGLLLARGREQEAVAAARNLLAARSSPRVRQNAIPLLADLLPVVCSSRSEAELHAAGGYLGELTEEMMSHLDDDDIEVRVLAAVELLKVASESDLAHLRPTLAPLLPRLRERRNDNPQVRKAVLRLGGSADALSWLVEIDATSGPLPPNVGELLDALDNDMPTDAVLLLPGLFVRLDAIAERRQPKQMQLGNIRVWDLDTSEAAKTLRLFLRGAGPHGVSACVDLMKAANPEMMATLLEESATEGEQAVLFFGAVAEDDELDRAVREKAVAMLGTLSRSESAIQESAIAKLRRLRETSELESEVDRILGQTKAANH